MKEPEIFSDEWLEGYINHGLEFWSKMERRELTPDEMAKFRNVATINNQNRTHCSWSTLAMLLQLGMSGFQS